MLLATRTQFYLSSHLLVRCILKIYSLPSHPPLGQELGHKAALLSFIQTMLDPLVAANAGNSASVALALRVLASLVTVEPNFGTFEDSKVGRR